jgi:hypothetical protein
MLVGVHDRGRGIGRDGWLADRQHVRSLARALVNFLRKLNDIIDVIVEVETAFADRHELGVAPVGDKHVMLRQHPCHRSAQQRRKVTRHGCDDQQRLARLHPFLAEMLELPERKAKRDILVDLRDLLSDLDFGDPELRLAARRGRMGKYFKARCNQRAHVRIAEGIRRVAEPSGAKACKFARTGQQRALHLIGVVKHPIVLKCRALGWNVRLYSTSGKRICCIAHPQCGN